jgi:hypothetical protein
MNPSIKKPDDSWRVCLNYTSLNKTCPKDEYPPPRINRIMDSMATSKLLSFLYAYSSYHQLNMSTEDEEKIVFITPFGVFCDVKLSFRLKNVGAT